MGFRARAILAVLAVAAAGACVLPDLDALQGGVASTGDASVDALADVTSSDALGADGALDAPPDATGDGGPCSGPLVLGANDPTIPGTDIIGIGSIDAYGYTAATSGTVRCAWIHLEGVGGGLQVGVYSHGDAGPNQLQAAGIIPSPKVGWNAVVLDKPITIAKGDVYWIGLLCAAAPPPTIRAVGACPNGNLKMWAQLTSSLPLQFSGTGPNSECSAPFYLTP